MSEHKFRPNKSDQVAGTSTNKAGAAAAAVGMAAMTAIPAVGPEAVGVGVAGMTGGGAAETVGAPTPMATAVTNEGEQV